MFVEEFAVFVLECRQGTVEHGFELTMLCLTLPLFQQARSIAVAQLLHSLFLVLSLLLTGKIRPLIRFYLRFLGLANLVKSVVQLNSLELSIWIIVVLHVIVVTLVFIVVFKHVQVDVFFMETMLFKAVALESKLFLLCNIDSLITEKDV